MDNEHHVKKAFLISMIVSLSISVLIGIVIFLLGSFGETQTRILLTTLTIVGFGLTLILLSFTFSHVSLLLLIDTERSSVKASLIGTILFIALVAFSLLAVIWDLIRFEQFYIRLFGVFAILDVLGTIITPIIYKVTKMKQQDTSFSQTY